MSISSNLNRFGKDIASALMNSKEPINYPDPSSSPDLFGDLAVLQGWSASTSVTVVAKGSPDIISHTVKPTDTLMGIAITYNLKPQQIKQFNGLYSDQLIAGQVILLCIVFLTFEGIVSQETPWNSAKAQRTTKTTEVK
jgi:LysM repeat protein